MFPEMKTACEILVFICNLDQIGCYADVSGKDVLTLRIALSEDGLPENYSVKHRKRYDREGLKSALLLAELAAPAKKE